MPTSLVLTGFEHGVTPIAGEAIAGALYDTVQTAAAISIVTSPVHSGTYAMQITATGLTTRTGWNFVASDRVISRFYVYFPTSLPAATVGLAHVLTTAGSLLLFRYNQATGKFNTIWGAVGSQDSTMTVAVDTWYQIDLEAIVNAATRTCDWQIAVDGEAQVAQTQSASTETASTATGFRLGGNLGQTLTAVYDDVYLSVTSGDYPISTEVSETELLAPASDGTHNAGTNIIEDQAGADIGVVTAFDLIDEVPISGAADYIRQFSNDATKYAEVLFGDTIQADILGVAGEVHMASSTNGFSCNGAMVVIRDDATEVGVLGTSASPAAFTNGGPGYKRAVITAPAGGWTQAEVNALKGRAGFSTDASPRPRFHVFVLEVAYTPGTGALLGGDRNFLVL